jgi:cytochrome b561
MSATETYAKPQIMLHWLIAALVVAQFLSAEAMQEFFEKAEDAKVLAGFPTDNTSMVHAIGGATILVLMLVRLGLRLSYGAPASPGSLSPLLQRASRFAHYAFYVLLVAVPLTGAASLYISSEIGDAHVILKNVLLSVIAAHVAGALAHAFYFKDGVVRRMLP